MTHFCNVAVDKLNWQEIGSQLDQEGYAMLPGLFDEGLADLMAAWIHKAGPDRPVSPAASEAGHGDVFFLTQALPEPLTALRPALYAPLSNIANRWNEVLGSEARFPAAFEAFRKQNKVASQPYGQSNISRLREQDYQPLSQRAEGLLVFPLQLVALLSEPGRDFTGGEFVMTEQRPRMQSRPMVLPLHRGDAAIITVGQRPFSGSRGFYRVNIKHAISPVRSGERIGLELLFHDANRPDTPERN